MTPQVRIKNALDVIKRDVDNENLGYEHMHCSCTEHLNDAVAALRQSMIELYDAGIEREDFLDALERIADKLERKS